MTHYTFNRYHLGDNLIFLNLLRALAKQHPDREFVHFCNGCDIPQLREAVEDLSNIRLEPFESPLWEVAEPMAIDTWKNAEGVWERSPVRWNWSSHQLSHHAWVAQRMGLESPFTCREHLLFDYPKCVLKRDVNPSMEGFLIVNSEPNSGQFGPMKAHGTGYLDELARALSKRHEVFTTKFISHEIASAEECHISISNIGSWSNEHLHHIMVMTGPAWPTLNTYNHHHHEGRKRIVLLDNGEQLNMPHIIQCANVDEVMAIAREEKWV